MLEILALIYLCKKNAENASLRGRKPGGFIALTVLLWFGMEVLAGVIGGLAELGAGVYPLAIAMAALGGFLSYRAAKNCRISFTKGRRLTMSSTKPMPAMMKAPMTMP